MSSQFLMIAIVLIGIIDIIIFQKYKDVRKKADALRNKILHEQES